MILAMERVAEFTSGAGDQDALIAAARSGDRAALEDLLIRIERPVYRFCYRILGDAAGAEDAAQETLLRVCRAIGSYEERGQFLAWVYRIAVNQAHSQRRRMARHEEIAAEPSGSDDFDRSERFRRAMDAMRVLTDKEREALVLIDIEGYSSQEAAGILGCLSITARTRAAHARKKVRRELSRFYPELRETGEKL
jgi:RNA polymerase sigma-70 factor (ECF subfamily)